MFLRAVLFTLGLALVPALGSAAPPSSTSPSAPASPAGADRVRLRTWLRALAAEAPSLAAATVKLEPARSFGPQPAARGLLLSLDAKGVRLDGAERTPDAATLGPEIVKARERNALLGVPPVTAAVLDIDGDARWPLVVKVTEELSARGIAEVAFRFLRPALARPFDHTPLDGELAQIATLSDPSQKSVRLAKLWSGAFVRCPRASKPMAALGSVAPGDKALVLLSLLDRLLGDPACELDAPSLQALVWAMLGNTSLQSLAVRLDRRAPGKDRVMAGFNGTWHEVVSAGLLDQAFAAGRARATWLVVAPR